MVTRIYFIGLFVVLSMIANAQNLTVYKSNLSVKETADKVVSIIEEKSLIYFETVSHDEIAKSRGITISPTRIILFEDSKLSSNLIVCEQTVALDLPLKIMIWEENEDVYIGYVDPLLMRRKFLIQGCSETLNEMSSLMSRIVNEALKSS